MKDQAHMLRTKMLKARNQSGNETPKNTKVIAIISGKGGVGKSNFTVNFSLALKKLGKKVLIFDLDIGMANVDILLGKSATYTIVDMLEKDLSIWDVVEKGPGGISFVGGGSALSGLFEMDERKLDYFVRELSALEHEFDYVLFDMAAGVSKNASQFLLSAHEIFLVTTPEPTAITDAYAAIKFINFQDDNIPINLIVNRTRNKREGLSTSKNMENVCMHFLNKKINFLTSIPDDEIVWKSVRAQSPFMLHSPNAKPSKAIYEAAKRYVENQIGESKEAERNFQSFLQKLTSFFRK